MMTFSFPLSLVQKIASVDPFSLHDFTRFKDHKKGYISWADDIWLITWFDRRHTEQSDSDII